MDRFLLSVVLASTLTLTSCQFDDTGIWEKFGEMEESIRDHEQRISALEELCKQMNTNIEALQTLVNALEKRDYVTNVSEVRSNGEVIGYTISFAYSDTITIYHGQDGKDGANGADGKDGYTPQIGVMEDTDGIYYWTLDGEWLLDDKGNKIQANGVNGTNGVTPQLKIENDYWYVSYDNDATWVQLGKATGEDGKDGQDSFIIGVEESETEVVFILSNNTTITIPKHAKSSLADPDDICTAMDDVKFMEYCYQNFDVNKDGKVSPVEAKSVRSIDISELKIYSIKGVEYFEILETFIAKNTLLRNVDLSFNSKLISFSLDGCSSLTSVIIPGSITSIGESAFSSCNSLTSITIPDGVTSIGSYAFSGCNSLTSVYITDIAAWCNISFVDYDSNPLRYAKNLYLNNELVTDLIIPDGATKIGSYAFRNYDLLTSITIPDSVTSIGDYAFCGCNSLTSVTIPDSVTSIGSYAFYGCDSLTSVTIPDSVTSIGGEAFYYCTSLTSVTIGNGVTSIGSGAFYNCTSLTSVTIGKGVTEIGKNAFSGCTGELIVNCNIPSASTSEYGVFYGSRFTRVTIGDSVTSIGSYAFYGCGSLASVTIPGSVTSIGSNAFRNCTSLTSVTIPDSVTSIGGGAFYDCTSLTSITIPDSVTSIGDYAFYSCDSLTSITIGNGVTSIGDDAFWNCDSLTSVTIGNGVTSIGDYAFYSCDSLTSVYITDIAAWCNISFVDSYSNPLYYAGNLYLNNELVTDLIIPDGATKIGSYAFYGYDLLTSVTIPYSVTSIGDDAFYNCTSLTSVYITDIAAWCNISFVDYDSNPLRYAKNLYLNNELVTDLIIPDGATKIGSYAFYGYDLLTSVTIPYSVTSIGSYAFRNCTSLTSVTIPDSVKSIGSEAFRYCTSLTSITIPDSVTSIGDDAFYNCNSLTSVTIGNSVTKIGEEAFSGCNSLKEVYCKPTTPPRGGSWMFDDNASGRTIYVPSNSVSAYKSASGWSDYKNYIVGYDF